MKWLKKLFAPRPISWPHSSKVALLFGINDYYGSDNDLRGCLNDLDLAESKLLGFQIRKFKDSQVTKKRFLAEVQYALDNALSGDVIYVHYSGHGTYVRDTDGDEIDGFDEALYLYDGPLIDDETGKVFSTVKDGVALVILLDSCYSGTASRGIIKSRFMAFEKDDNLFTHKRVKRAVHESMRWVVISGCGENQTSADAYINGKYNGAFTFYAMSCLRGRFTYQQWFDEIRKYLPNEKFDQEPTIEGPAEILSKQVFT